MTEIAYSVPVERGNLLPTFLVVLACLLVTAAILMTPARANRNLSTQMVLPPEPQKKSRLEPAFRYLALIPCYFRLPM